MRRLLFLLPALFALGCRAPSIPAQPSGDEYAVYRDLVEHASSTLPHGVELAVRSSTLTLDQNSLQFQQCLPRRMANVFDNAVAASLVSTSGNDWLMLADGRPSSLIPDDATPTFAHPTELFRVSRVAFTRSGYDAYLWVEHRTCFARSQTGTQLPTGYACDSPSGDLLHGTKSSNSWSFEETICHTVSVGDELPNPA